MPIGALPNYTHKGVVCISNNVGKCSVKIGISIVAFCAVTKVISMKAFALTALLAAAFYFVSVEMSYTFLGLEFSPIIVIGRTKDKKESK